MFVAALKRRNRLIKRKDCRPLIRETNTESITH